MRLWGPLVAAAHRTPWQDLGGEDSGAPGILEAEEVVGSTLGGAVRSQGLTGRREGRGRRTSCLISSPHCQLSAISLQAFVAEVEG